MTVRLRDSPRIWNLSHGFGAWQDIPKVVECSHTHTDIELNYFTAEPVKYFLAGRFETFPVGRLAVFWAGLPHHLVHVPPNPGPCWVVNVPLAWFMQWQMSDTFTEHLMAGEVILEPPNSAPESEFEKNQMQQWVELFSLKNDEARRIVMLEVEARVRRLALGGVASIHRPVRHIAEGGSAHVERVCRFIAQHYTEELTVETIAKAASLHPNYLMQLFNSHCGMGIWEYLLRLRTSHAQRLLITTDMKIVDVALESGFGSMSRFHVVFSRYCGSTPRQYRKNCSFSEK